MAFDPDEYLAAKKTPSSGSFDPDAYLASKKTSSKEPQQESTIGRIKRLSGYDTSPVGLMDELFNKTRKGAERVGEFGAEELARSGVDPRISAAAGTFVSMAPDLLMTAASPAESLKTAPKSANWLARRALGFQKPFLKTPFARGQAKEAAKIALEKDVIPLSGNPETMLNRATALKANAGREIGETLKQTPAPVQIVLEDLSNLKLRLSEGANEGILTKANPMIDDVVKSIEDLATSPKAKPMTAETLTKIKTKVSGMVNYLSDLATQTDNKAIAGQMGNTIRNLVKTFNSPEIYSRFIGNQKLYNAYSTMVKGLNNEVAAQMSNMPVSLPSAVLGAGKMAASAGNPVAGLAAMGLVEGVKRRGAGMTARALVDLYRAQRMAPKLSPVAGRLLRGKE